MIKENQNHIELYVKVESEKQNESACMQAVSVLSVQLWELNIKADSQLPGHQSEKRG